MAYYRPQQSWRDHYNPLRGLSMARIVSMAETFWDKALTPAAIGLMNTGNTGIFRDRTRSGLRISQIYNLSVAYLGAKNYNTRAARTAPNTAPRANVRHALQDERDRLLREARERARGIK